MDINNISKLSLGCASFGNHNAYGCVTQDIANSLVYTSFYSCNINYFDTSPYYGNSETVLGKSLSFIPREYYFIGTKVGRYMNDKTDFSLETIKNSIETSLKNLNTSYIDIVQCHDVEFGNIEQIINEALPYLQTLKDKKIIRYIGITGLSLPVLDYIVTRSSIKIDTILTYCNYSLHCNLLNNYIDKWISQNIKIIQGGCTSMGLLTDKGPPDWHPANNELKDKCKEISTICSTDNENITKVAFQYIYNNTKILSVLIGPTNTNELQNYYRWKSTESNILLEDKIIQLFEKYQNYIWIEPNTEKNILHYS